MLFADVLGIHRTTFSRKSTNPKNNNALFAHNYDCSIGCDVSHQPSLIIRARRNRDVFTQFVGAIAPVHFNVVSVG